MTGTPMSRLAGSLELVVASQPPTEFRNDGSLDSYTDEASSLVTRFPHLRMLQGKFQSTIGALHPQTYTTDRWIALQTAAGNLATELRAFESSPHIVLAVNNPSQSESDETLERLGDSWCLAECADVASLQQLALAAGSIRYLVIDTAGTVTRSDLDPYISSHVSAFGINRRHLGFE